MMLLKCKVENWLIVSSQSMVAIIINLPIKENTELYLLLGREPNVMYD